MAKGVKGFQKGHKHGVRFGEEQDNTKGGRKLKIYNVIKQLGYGYDDVKTAFGEIAFYDDEQLQELIGNSKAPIITKIIAKALKKAYDDGNYSLAKDILEQVIGKPKETKQVTAKVDHSYSDKTDEELEQLINDAEQKG